MNNNTPSQLSRRNILRSGGAIVASGAVLAACGGASHSGSIARIGSVPEIDKLETEHVSDVVLLRTAMSVEKMVATIMKDSRVTSLAESSVSPFLAKYAAAHETNMSVLAPLVTARGGQVVNEPNAKLMTAYGENALNLVEEGKTAGDVLNLTLGLESLVAATYQYFVSLTNEAALRADMMRLGAASSRRAAVAAQLIRGGTVGFSPAINEKGEELTATLPSAFGTLSAVQVVLGPVNEVGTRSPISMDTPSLNSMLY
ncbi:MAG: hypothetical protein ACK45J_04400 [Acidimicrobiaceae bacterium]|jgi:hypothetical protein|nr:hypothetical protein [Ilumatobacteraceae bacterium]